jgi:hypothetical protein
MKKIYLALIFLFPLTLQSSVHENLKKILPQGDHVLLKEKSSDDCMDGSISYIEYEEEGKKHQLMLISSRIGFSIDKATFKEEEKIEGGCDYEIATTINDTSIKRETKRQACPVDAENTTVKEEVLVTKTGFSYTLEDGKADKRECHYTFSKGDSQ